MASTPRYRERLIPGVVPSIVAVSLALVFGVAFGAALGAVTGWATFVLLLLLLLILGVLTAPVIEVRDDTVRVGRAVLPRAHVASVEPLDADSARDARGPHADARQYLVLKPMAAQTAVRITLSDPDDPHPSWLVTTRHPAQLAAALQ